MKLVSFEYAKRPGFGVVAEDGGIIDLTDRLGEGIATLRQAIAAGALDRIRTIAAGAKSGLAVDQVRLLPPIPEPGKIICIGAAYRNAKHKDGSVPLPRYPSIFLRIPRSFTGHREKLLLPPESVQLDYEGEIGIVIGKGGRRIAEQDAEGHIAGLTVMNEGTVRDWLKHGNYGAPGKNFDASGACGPWLVTADEFKGYDDIRVTTKVNGVVRQDDTTANLIFPFRHVISYVSQWTTLEPGDLIASGTPAGTGINQVPPVWLQAGDIVEVQVAGVGALSNLVAAEA
jgi:2-keto-4-pentenoate hydratase/2-oxohepta-3-ene-1,7-dioic acid hydratase in catechol pathway